LPVCTLIRPIEADLKKMQAVINHAKGITTIFAIDSNSRSTSWNDVLTNKRGRAVEEFITTNQLYIANEESCYTIFQNSRGASNIDLTILNNTAIKLIQERAMHDKESCSDHNIIHYILGNEAFRSDVTNKERRYAVTQKGLEKFQEMVIVTMENIARGSEKADKIDDTLDVVLCRRTSMATTSEAAVEELHSVLDYTCRSSFKQTGKADRGIRHKSVPWWTTRLTIMRREVNAERQRYQRTKLNDELRRQRREKYLVSKAEYAAAIRQEKSRSWKEYCNATSEVNPWNAICKMTAGKTKRVAHITTLRQLDGSLTTDLQGTLSLMIQKFAPEDNQEDDTDNHRQTRNLKSMTMDMDDAEFTEQVTNVLHDTGNKRAPGKEGIPNEVWKGLVKILRKYITAIYNKCLKEGVFPKRWKTAKIIPIVKPGKEGSDEVSKFRPISILASGGKVLEKLLINRINHHVYTRGHMNENQFGFRPQ